MHFKENYFYLLKSYSKLRFAHSLTYDTIPKYYFKFYFTFFKIFLKKLF